jgi:6-phosphogluconolactonase (cycloisomerase 2 family)
MAKVSPATDKCINRRIVLKGGAALGAAGPVLLRGGYAEAQPQGAGAGPRHIAFHSQMPLAYVINELDSSVTTYRFDAQRGSLQPIQILPSIPASYTGNNTGAEIAVALSGRVVYASNRGHDSIALLLSIGATGP